jgi:acyl-CoA thioester hydrolase
MPELKRIRRQATRQLARPFSWPVRVYYEDTDHAGVVYYANYLRYFERARTEWLRALGIEQPDLAARDEVIFVVRSIAVEYLQPARFNDVLDIDVELEHVGASQITMSQRACRGDEKLAEARVRLACIGLPQMKPVRMPQVLTEKISEISEIKTI